MYPECIIKKDTYPQVRYISNDSQSYRYKCILMYLDVSRCILMYMNGTHQDTIRIHARYIEIHQDTYPIGNHPQKG